MNVTGTLNVLVASRDAEVERVVYASSAAVYGNADVLPLHESMTTRPASPYALSKLAGSDTWRRSPGRTDCRRWPCGTSTSSARGRTRDRSTRRSIPRFISCALTGDAPTIFADGEQARDFVFVEDVVRANILAAEAAEPAWGRAFNIGRGERRTVSELLAAIRTLVPGDHPAAEHAPPRAGEVRDSWSDIGAARELLNYEPHVAFEDGLSRTIEWIARGPDADLRYVSSPSTPGCRNR